MAIDSGTVQAISFANFVMPVLKLAPDTTTQTTMAQPAAPTQTATNTAYSGMASQFVQIDGVDYQSSMNVEQWMLLVQQERVGQLDQVVKDQAQEIHNRNDAIAKLNTALAAITAIQAKFNADAKATDVINQKIAGWDDRVYNLEITANDALEAAGVAQLFSTAVPSQDSAHGLGNIFNGYGVSGYRTKGDIDGAISKLKSTIDSLSNLQQMDTLRLQSVMNKRNEGFDIMSNFIKKYADSMEAIIRNMT